MIQFLKDNYPKLIGLLVSLAVGVLIGWTVKPTKVEEKIKVVEVEKQVVVEKEKVRVEVVHVKDTQVVERWHREKTEEKRPDGTVIAKETEDRNIDSVVHDKTNSTEIKVVEVEKQVVVEREKVVERKPILPDWHVGLLFGAAPKLTVVDTSLVVGVEAERRIAGPFFAGIWITGSSVLTSFQPANPVLGLKLGAEF